MDLQSSHRSADQTDLAASVGLQTALVQLRLQVKTCRQSSDHSTTTKVSGLRLARQDSKCACSITCYSSSSPQGLKTHVFECFRRPPRGPRDVSKTPAGSLPGARPPRGSPRGPKTLDSAKTLCFTGQNCLLAQKLNVCSMVFRLPRGFQEAPRGPPACQQRATAVSQARHKRVTGVPPFSFLQETRKRRSTQEALKRPSRGPQGAPKRPPRGLQETPKRPLRGLPEAPRGFKRPQEAPRGSPWLTVQGRRHARSA